MSQGGDELNQCGFLVAGIPFDAHRMTCHQRQRKKRNATKNARKSEKSNLETQTTFLHELDFGTARFFVLPGRLQGACPKVTHETEELAKKAAILSSGFQNQARNRHPYKPSLNSNCLDTLM